MKKVFILLIAIFLSFQAISQEIEREYRTILDGKELKNTSGIKIFSPKANKSGLTVVEITLHAKVKGKIKGKVIKKNA